MCGIVGYIGSRQAQDVLIYKVKWMGYDKVADQTWEPVTSL